MNQFASFYKSCPHPPSLINQKFNVGNALSEKILHYCLKVVGLTTQIFHAHSVWRSVWCTGVVVADIKLQLLLIVTYL